MHLLLFFFFPHYLPQHWFTWNFCLFNFYSWCLSTGSCRFIYTHFFGVFFCFSSLFALWGGNSTGGNGHFAYSILQTITTLYRTFFFCLFVCLIVFLFLFFLFVSLLINCCTTQRVCVEAKEERKRKGWGCEPRRKWRFTRTRHISVSNKQIVWGIYTLNDVVLFFFVVVVVVFTVFFFFCFFFFFQRLTALLWNALYFVEKCMSFFFSVYSCPLVFDCFLRYERLIHFFFFWVFARSRKAQVYATQTMCASVCVCVCVCVFFFLHPFWKRIGD